MALSEAPGQRHNEKMLKQPVLVVAAVFYQQSEIDGTKVALFRRSAHVSGAGSWEFPGGKVDVGETETQALVREIDEELGLRIKVEALAGSCEHDYGNKLIHLVAYFASPANPPGNPSEFWGNFQFHLVDHDASKWVSQNEIKIDELAPADRPLVNGIFELLAKR